MTEVPEHLLRRSKERRAALGLGGDGGDQPSGGAASASPAAVPAGAGASTASPAGSGSAAVEAAPIGEGSPSRGPIIEEAPAPIVVTIPRRPKVPVFIVPVLAMLPVWAFVYLGAFGNRTTTVSTDPVELGNTVFHNAGCSGCHGANGEGGVGPAMAGVKKTFPKLADHISWVNTGSAPFTGKVYGNSGRVATGAMPAFGPTAPKPLSPVEIAQVVCYERVTFGGGTEAADCPAAPGSPGAAAGARTAAAPGVAAPGGPAGPAPGVPAPGSSGGPSGSGASAGPGAPASK